MKGRILETNGRMFHYDVDGKRGEVLAKNQSEALAIVSQYFENAESIHVYTGDYQENTIGGFAPTNRRKEVKKNIRNQVSQIVNMKVASFIFW